MKKSAFTCSECGSRNTVLRDRPPSGWLDWLKDRFMPLTRPNSNGIPMGQKFIVCKDCGHVSCIHIL